MNSQVANTAEVSFAVSAPAAIQSTQRIAKARQEMSGMCSKGEVKQEKRGLT